MSFRERSARDRLLDAICIGGFVLAIGYPLVLTPLEPSLLAIHPILVETALGTAESFVTAGAFARVGLIGQGAVDFAQLVTHYAGLSTVVLIVLLIAVQVWRARQR